MGGDALTFKLFGLTFNTTNIVSGLIIYVIVFFTLYGMSRKIKMKPTGAQNVFEWLVDFTNGIVRSQMPAEEQGHYSFFAFVLFVFIFFANQFGLLFQFHWNGAEVLRSPTADPVVTLTLSLMVMTMAHFAGVAHNGVGGYIKNYAKPFTLMFPVNIIEDFANFLTLGLRIFGNIFAGELLMSLIANMAFSHGILTIIPGLLLELCWQGFSVFIGAIQAYVFVTLTTVYISRKISE
ncbi:F0F1 ATP synthase subunit A [Limosilactobacillus sp.]|uniref:F0F1 ATP synthase subunit A n=1 Tax=Limosilactobacillus sp. TaxID=2773925 RepID=UPI0035A1001A